MTFDIDGHDSQDFPQRPRTIRDLLSKKLFVDVAYDMTLSPACAEDMMSICVRTCRAEEKDYLRGRLCRCRVSGRQDDSHCIGQLGQDELADRMRR